MPALKITTDKFIQRARSVHGDKYTYEKTEYKGAHARVTITCSLHGDFEQIAADHWNGKGCPECGKNTIHKSAFTTEEFVRKARTVHGDKYDYSKSLYKTFKKPIIITCPDHGDFTQVSGAHLKGHGCLKCGQTRNREHKRPNGIRKEWFLHKAEKLHGKDAYDYSGITFPVKSGDKVSIVCRVHGPFERRVSDFIYGKGCGCPKCAQERSRLTAFDVFVEKARALYGERYDYSKVYYVNNHTNVEIICPKHGLFNQTPSNHLNGHGCPHCAAESKVENNPRTLSWPEMLIKFREVHGDKYTYAGYVNTSTRMEVICPTHGITRMKPIYHLLGYGCPRCSGNTSLGESQLGDWVKSLRENVVFQDRELLDRRELDIYLPDRKLAIEYNGVYWHSHTLKADKNYHKSKWEMAAAKGVQLIHVWEHDWKYRKELIQSMLRARLGLFTRKLHGRECQVRELDFKTAKDFCNQHHLRGYSGSSVRLGLYHGDELVSVMTFGGSRFRKAQCWEMIRFCTQTDTSVSGGASKLWKYFQRNWLKKGDLVVSYANTDYSKGSLYTTLGFTRTGHTPPNYIWVHMGTGKLLSRYQTLKGRVSKHVGETYDSGLSPDENMEKAGYSKLFDSGNLVFEYVHPES